MVLADGPLAPRESAVDACFAALRSAILEGRLVPGERLPPERALAERFGVNRVTVRGALGRLGATRLLSVRQGSGWVVADYRRDGGPDLLSALVQAARAQGDLAALAGDLLAIRRALARATLQRLEPGVSARHRAAIRRAVSAFEDAVQRGADDVELARADVGVLGALLDATDSAVFALCLNPIVAVLTELTELRRTIYAAPETNAAAWRALADALGPRRPGLADDVERALAQRDARTVDELTRPRRRRGASSARRRSAP